MAAAAKIVTGIVAVGAGAILGQGWLVMSGLGLIASGLTTPGQPTLTPGQSRTRIPLPSDRLPVLYGVSRASGLYAYVSGISDASALWLVVVLGHGEIAGIDEIFIDGNLAVLADGRVRPAPATLQHYADIGGPHLLEVAATSIKSLTADYPCVLETDAAHDLAVGDLVRVFYPPAEPTIRPLDGEWVVVGVPDTTHFSIGTQGIAGYTNPHGLSQSIQWIRENPGYEGLLSFAKYLGPDNQDMSLTGKQINLVGAARANGAVTAGHTTIAIDSAGSLVGTLMPGDTFTAAGETGSPVHTVTNGPASAAGNAIAGVTFTPAAAAGGIANHAALTISHVGFTAASLTAALPEWDAAHKLGGIAYVLLRLQANDQILHGLPSIACTVRGRKVYDPRGPSTAYSTNPALCARDLMTSTRYGWALPSAKVNDGDASFGVIAEANYHETQPNQPRGDGTFAITTTTAATSRVAAPGHGFSGGAFTIWVRGNSTVPDGEYAVTVVDANTLHFSAYTVLADGVGGTLQFVVPAAARHSCNGLIDCNQPIRRGLEAVLSAGRADVIRIGSLYQPFTRRALGQTIANYVLDDRRLRGGQAGLKLAGLQGSANGLDVTFADALQGYQLVTFPWPAANVTNTFLAEDDGIVNRKSLQLPFTTDRYIAQRIANVILRELRAQNIFTPTTTEDLLQASSGDVIAVVNRLAGWGPTESSPGLANKLFWVLQLGLRVDQLIDAVLLDYEATAYDDVLVDDARYLPLTSLPSPWVVQAPFLPLSGHLCSTGTPDPRIRVEWLGSVDGTVVAYEVQAQRTTSGGGAPVDAAFRSYGRATPDEPALWIPNVANGDIWDVRVRAINRLGRYSPWLQETHTVVVTVGASVTVTRTADATKVSYLVTAVGTTRHIKLYSVDNAGAGGTNPVESIENRLRDTWIAEGASVTWDIPTTSGHYRRTLIVAFDESLRRGSDSGILEDQATTSGAAPSAAPSGLTQGTATQTTQPITWTNGDASAKTRVWVNGVIVKSDVAAGVSGYTIPDLEAGLTYQIKLDHYKNGQASATTAVVNMTTASAPAAPAAFTAGSQYETFSGGKYWENYDFSFTAGGAWEIYEATDNDVTHGVQILTGAAGTHLFSWSRLKGTTPNYYYWVRYTDDPTGPSAWRACAANPFTYLLSP